VRSRRTFLQSAAGTLAAFRLKSAAYSAPPGKTSPLPYVPIDQIPNHRQWMRDVVIALSDYCKKRHADMTVLVRNGPELLIKEKREADWQAARDPGGSGLGHYSPVGSTDGPYLAAIDGMLVDGLFFGFDAYDQPTRPSDQSPLLAATSLLQNEGRRNLLIDYCQDAQHRKEAALRAKKADLLTYLDGDGDKRLNRIPAVPPATENPRHIGALSEAQNFLPVMTSTFFARRDSWLEALAATNYDLLLVDPFFRGSSMTVQEVRALQFKRIGSRRLVYAPLPVGFAAVDRFFWQKGWHSGTPDWLGPADPDHPTRFLVSYWLDSWKQVLGRYVTGLCDLGVDGVVLEGVDSYLYYEAMLPF